MQADILSVAFKEVRRGLGYEEAPSDLWTPPGTYRWFLPPLSWELGISVRTKMTVMHHLSPGHLTASLHFPYLGPQLIL